MRPYDSPQEAFQGFKFHNTKDPNKGIDSKRVKFGPLELFFARAWAEENRPIRSINFGYGMLQDLFMERNASWGFPMVRKRISKRERMIVATVIQWLGTNVGFCFLTRVLDECGYKLERKKND